MTFKSSLIAIALACASLTACAKAPVDLGPATPGVPLSFNAQVGPVGAFVDTFMFSLPTNAGSGYSVIDFPLSIQNVGTFKTLFTSVSLYWTGVNGIIGGGDDLLIGTSITPGPGKVTLAVGPQVAGNYYIDVAGRTDGTLGGLYNGAIGVTAVSPVPEPTTYAMFALGLGIMGAIARRRSK